MLRPTMLTNHGVTNHGDIIGRNGFYFYFVPVLFETGIQFQILYKSLKVNDLFYLYFKNPISC